MPPRPGGIGNPYLRNRLIQMVPPAHRNRHPRNPPVRSLDPVPVPPISRGVLHLIVQNELVNRMDDVKISLPRDVIALEDRNPLTHGPPRSSRWVLGHRA